MNLRKGISPVIATVIIVAVALAIAIAVVGWIMGIWGAVAGGTEMLRIYPDSYISGQTLVLHIKNEGSTTAVIYKIEISGLTTITVYSSDETHTALSETATISAGTDTTLTMLIPSGVSPTAGVIYTVKVYTLAGNVYTAQVSAQ